MVRIVSNEVHTIIAMIILPYCLNTSFIKYYQNPPYVFLIKFVILENKWALSDKKISPIIPKTNRTHIMEMM